MAQWSYEDRRSCQPIVGERVFLGPFSVQKEASEMNRLRMTHVVLVRDERERFYVRPTHPSALAYLCVDLAAQTPQAIIPLFSSLVRFLNDTLAVDGTRVLVCCASGISLAPAFIVAYVMASMQLSLVDAYRFVEMRRMCIDPDDRLRAALKEFEPIARALSMSALHSHPDDSSLNDKRIRSADDDGAEDASVRAGITPFR